MKVKIVNDFSRGGLCIYFYKEIEGKRYLCEPMEMVFNEYLVGELCKGPSLVIPESSCEEFIKCFQDEFERKGIRSKSELTLEGELKAKDLHLSDMRKLVFRK